jgi:hypothetical protein
MQPDEYKDFQEQMAFEKELNILRNDFYYKLIDGRETTLVDFMYYPLDTLSGDIYTARQVTADKIFYLLVDGMGKGLSASLTSMILTAYINHKIDKMFLENHCCFEELIEDAIEFIRPILLDEEAVAIDFICFDTSKKKLHYAKFAMPISLLQKENNEVLKIKSNNPPLSKWTKKFQVDTFDVEEVNKFLFISDGIVESKTKDGSLYIEHIEKDFKCSFTREEFKAKLFDKLDDIEDDLTLIFLNKLPLDEKTFVLEKTFETSLNAVEEASEWYSVFWEKLAPESNSSARASIVFSELFMNAYEHGNLNISSETKHKMLEEDTYIDTLLEYEKKCIKSLHVKIYKLHNAHHKYLITEIADEGDGFDTQVLSKIFRNSHKFNGRGVFVSRKNSIGIYYNTKGNKVLFLNKI